MGWKFLEEGPLGFGALPSCVDMPPPGAGHAWETRGSGVVRESVDILSYGI